MKQNEEDLLQNNEHDYSVFKNLQLIDQELKASISILKEKIDFELNIVITNKINNTSIITQQISKTLMLTSIINMYIDNL